MIDWSRPFAAASHPARAYLLQKGVFLLLAFDAWLTMLPHGARYGMGGFNVTHFAWLDAWMFVPSAAFYAGLTSLIGCLALLHVLTGGARFLRVAITCLYTCSWTISLFDSHQHHYLLSWILLWTIFMPDVPPESAQRRDVSPVPGIGLPMTCMTCGIVYMFTALAKSELDWRAGHVLIRLSKSKVVGHPDPGVLDPLRNLLMSVTHAEELAVWALIAHSVIALQVVSAVGYCAAAERDARRSFTRSLLCGLALLATSSFHVFAELGGMFDIGWFSYYMLWLAFTLLSPSAWLTPIARLFAWPGMKLARLSDAQGHEPAAGPLLIQLTASAVMLCSAGWLVDLPGVWGGLCLVAMLVLAWGALQVQAHWMRSAQGLAIASILSAGACFMALTQSSARFDFYRRGAGELRALGQLEPALAMYRKADRYARPGQSRKKQVRELERMIRAAARDSD